MRAYILCCMRMCVCLSLHCLIFWLLFYIPSCSITLFWSFSLFRSSFMQCYVCALMHINVCLCLLLYLSLSPYFFATLRRFTKNEKYERKGKLRVEKENFNEMKWTEEKTEEATATVCSMRVCGEYSFETFRCAPPYVCLGVASSSGSS